MGSFGNHAAKRIAEERSAPELQALARSAVAADVGDTMADGVCFVGLANITDAGMVLSAIARALGVREPDGRPFAL